MNQLRLVAILIFSTASLSSVWAVPFDGRQLPADSQWAIHLDMEAFHNSAVGKMVQDSWLVYEKAQKYVVKVIAETGMDPTKDFLGVTVYDNQFRKEHGVAMLHVRNVDGSRLLAQLNTKEPDNRMVEYGNHKLYLWTKRHRKQEMTVCGTLYEGHTILCSRNPLKVMAALDVLDGNNRA